MNKQLHILILEDDNTDAELIKHELQNANITFTSNCVETKEAFQENLENFVPDIILADYTLPSFDGCSAMRIVKEKCPDVPFIFVSGTIGEDIAIESLKNGATDYVLKDGISRLVPAVHRALREIDEKIEYRKAQKALKESELRFRSVVQSANDAIILMDGRGSIVSWNAGARSIFGYTEKEVLGMSIMHIMPKQYKDHGQEKPGYVNLVGNIGKTVESYGLRKDGSEFPLEISTAAWKTEEEMFYSIIIRDITERKSVEKQIEASLKEKEMLLREIHHRVKNNMQVISSLLWLQSGYIKDKKYLEMFRDSQNRITTMSLVHEKLYMSKDLANIEFKEYIRDLVNGLFQSHGVKAETIELKINVGNVLLGIDHAIPCGLIINELITNSLKYAFSDKRKGEIKVSLHINHENMVELIVSDNGMGIPSDLDFRKTESLGLRLVTILSEDQLHGNIDLDRSRGTEFKIKFNGGK
jgi:PAS domain S-box-containing protein